MEIQNAVYTSVLDLSNDGKKGMDVTDQLTKLIDPDTNTVTIPEGQHLNKVFGKDPEPFHPKVLRVKYTINGEAHTKTIYEISDGSKIPRVIGGPSDAAVTKPKKPEQDHLAIEKAVYGGIQGSQKDVTEAVSALVDRENDTVTFPKSMKFNEFFGGDPAPYAVKQLVVDYKLNGVSRQEVIPEKRKHDVLITDECGERKFATA